MSDSTLRGIIVVVIALLLVHQAAVWLAELMSRMGATVVTVVVAGFTAFCAYMARAGVGRAGWFILPTALFTVIPLTVRTWRFFTEGKSLVDRLLEHAPFFVGFLFPMALLLVVFIELRKREPAGLPPPAAKPPAGANSQTLPKGN